MSKRMALVPPEFLIGHQAQKTELRLEDEVSKLLDREQLADDLKVKLLSQLLTRYQNTAREPSEPVRVSIVDENEHPRAVASQKAGEQFEDKMLENVKADAELDPILKDIITSSPRSYVKYIPSIVEKLITRGYSWNKYGEMTRDNLPIKDSRIVDFFSYLLRNIKTQTEPVHFQIFFKAIREINIPHSWVGNKKLLPLSKYKDNNSSMKRSVSSPELDDEKVAMVEHGGWQSPSRMIKEWRTY
ncbi:uncharacterized protein TNCT_556201 [Trichonephila clavata]|uniref:Uncharacterized protein n=1 Tax=Trichonephila clavata TaxID=2740835 RepID=A0A8X6LGN1_TRICU|nr:uncharacterized protein TNCT_556201 [Trichonephila clavata]